MMIGGLIVTYNPDLKILEKNIKRTMDQVEACVIVDNGSKNADKIKHLGEKLGATLIVLKKNIGIAAAQNKGFESFKLSGFAWVLTLDQDSVIPVNTVRTYLESKKIEDNTTGIITAKYCDPNWTEEQKNALIDDSIQGVNEKKFVISSGNLVRVSAWKRVHGFDEFLFIDMVDYDFDAKLKLAGYKIWQVNGITMGHSVGKTLHSPVLQRVLLLPRSALLADHPAFRQYYIYRNTIIFKKRYPMFEKQGMLILRSIIATRRILVYTSRFSKFKAAWKGIIDGVNYNPKQDKSFQKIIKKI